MSTAHTIKTVQVLPTSLDKAWDFFSNPANLAQITPSYLGFKIKSKHHGSTMYAGQIIEYTVKPILGIPLYWMTEITQVKDGVYFIDEQRYGPYSLWHHQHHFKAVANGVEMTDIVHYKIPLGFIGRILHRLFIKKQVEKIFNYRFQKADDLFSNK
jgi:ligand-binding SRPBCC domain-containing protein